MRADARAKFASVAGLVDEVHSAGTDEVGLLTEKVKPRPATAQP